MTESIEDLGDQIEALNGPEKVLLLLLSSNNSESIPGNLWLQKEMFLISRNSDGLDDYLDYQPHLQGPYSETLESLFERLQFKGLATKNRRKLSLTEKGELIANAIEGEVDESILNLVDNVKELANDLSKDELLVYIYYTFPEMTVQSLEIDDLEEKRESTAKKLYNRGKVTLEKASELAGTTPGRLQKAT